MGDDLLIGELSLGDLFSADPLELDWVLLDRIFANFETLKEVVPLTVPLMVPKEVLLMLSELTITLLHEVWKFNAFALSSLSRLFF